MPLDCVDGIGSGCMVDEIVSLSDDFTLVSALFGFAVSLPIALFEFSDPDGMFSSFLSIISFSTLFRLCLSFTNSKKRLVSLILLLKSIFLVGFFNGDTGERARLFLELE